MYVKKQIDYNTYFNNLPNVVAKILLSEQQVNELTQVNPSFNVLAVPRDSTSVVASEKG